MKKGVQILPYFTEKTNLVRKGLSKLFIAFGSESKIQKKAEHKQNSLPDRKPQQFYFNYLHFYEFGLKDNIVFPTILQYHSFQPYSTSSQITISIIWADLFFFFLFKTRILISRFFNERSSAISL